MKIKASRKYTMRFKKMAFGGEPDGEVLSMHTLYDINGNILEEIKTDDDEGTNERNIYTYDAEGRILSHQLLMETEGISETFVYERDEKGRLLSETKFYGDDAGEKSVYRYEAHEHPVAIKRYDSDGELETDETITYNENNLPVEQVKKDASGNLIERTVLIYNDLKKPTEKQIYDSQNKISKTSYVSYNEKDELSRILEKNSEGKLTSDIKTTYDERGNVIERKVRDFHSRTLRFNFDEHDNCIAEEMYDENGNLTMKSNFEFDENSNLLSESGYYMDMNRSAQMANVQSRYEYEYWETVAQQ